MWKESSLFRANQLMSLMDLRRRASSGELRQSPLPWSHAAGIFCSTNLQTAVNFRFSKAYTGDYVVGRVANPDLPLSTAVTASSAFPPFLSPLVLTLPAGSFTDWPGQPAGAGGVMDPVPFRSKILLTDGGVYDNHGLEPLVKRYMTILASDGGAPFARMPDVATDPIRQLQHVFDVTGNQVRSLRRRDLVARHQQANKQNLSGDQVDAYARLGAYWGIDTDPSKVTPAGSLPCSTATVHTLASLPTRLSDLGTTQSKQLINWGYAICDRCVRAHYSALEPQGLPAPQWPYPEAKLA
jgi:NTE family protein